MNFLCGEVGQGKTAGAWRVEVFFFNTLQFSTFGLDSCLSFFRVCFSVLLFSHHFIFSKHSANHEKNT